MKRAAPLLLALVLLVAGLGRISMLAAYQATNSDEEAGIGEALSIPAGELLRNGPPVEVNPSPLHYLVDKAWIHAHGGTPHYRYNLNLFFRVLPIAYVVAGSVLLALLSLELALAFSLPALPACVFAFAAGIFFQTNLFTLSHAAVSDRPYAFFYLLTCVQLRLLARAKPGLSWKFGLAHLLMCFNSFGAAVQVGVVVLLRARSALRPFRARELLLLGAETLPAAAVAVWYWIDAPRMFEPAPEQRGLAELWLEALGDGVFAPSAGFFSGATHDPTWSFLGWPAVLAATALLLAAPFLARPFRNLGLALPLFVLAAVPVTWVALNVANTLQPRYFVFLYPAMGFAQVLAVLAAARWLGTKSRKAWAPGLLLLLWSAGQVAYRVPAALEDSRAMKLMARYSLYYPGPRVGCPEHLGAFRRGASRGESPGDVDIARLQQHCLPEIPPAKP